MIPQNRSDETIDRYSNAIEKNPDDGDAYYNLGIILTEKG